MSGKWCEAGTSVVRDGVLFVRCKGGAVDESGSAPDYGEVPMCCALGVTAVPFPPTDDGAVEILVNDGVAGFDAVATNGRDTRSAAAIGNAKPGDTIIHSTGPQQAAQLQLKEEKRQVVGFTKSALGKAIMWLLDGDGDGKIQITIGGAMIQLDGASGDISILNKSGAGILIQGGNVHFLGTPILGAGNAPGMYFCVAPAPSPGGVASLPFLLCQGVAPGT